MRLPLLIAALLLLAGSVQAAPDLDPKATYGVIVGTLTWQDKSLTPYPTRDRKDQELYDNLIRQGVPTCREGRVPFRMPEKQFDLGETEAETLRGLDEGQTLKYGGVVATRKITAAGTLNLDHVRAEVGEVASTERSRDRLLERQHAYPGERSGRVDAGVILLGGGHAAAIPPIQFHGSDPAS